MKKIDYGLMLEPQRNQNFNSKQNHHSFNTFYRYTSICELHKARREALISE